MKIEIQNIDMSGSRGYNLYADGKKLSKPNASIFPFDWDDEELIKLLGEATYDKFCNGAYQFNLPTWKIRLIEGKQAAANREQLLFISQFND